MVLLNIIPLIFPLISAAAVHHLLIVFSEFVNETNNPSQLKVEGDRYSMPELAKTLKMIALNGVEAFYEGKIGDKFVQDVQWRGGIITKEDLIHYRYNLFGFH